LQIWQTMGSFCGCDEKRIRIYREKINSMRKK